MKRDLLLIAIITLVVFFTTREFFPKVVEKQAVPVIRTVYDTVPTLPEWYADSLPLWKKRKHTTDTLEVVIRETVVDTQYIPVNAPPDERPNLWPVLSYRGGSRFGDTAVVSSFDVRTGRLGVSTVFIPGILTSIEADSNASPKFTFAPFPELKKPSLFYKLKMVAIGFGACSAINMVR